APPPDQSYDQRVSAITPASQAFFENIGAWDGMARRRISPVQAMHVWSSSGQGAIHFEAAEIGEACLAWIIENSAIRSALLERLQQFTNVHYLCPVQVRDINLTEEAATLTL